MASVVEFTVNLESSEILISLGYTNAEKASHETMHKIKKIQNEFSNNFRSLAIYQLIDFSSENNTGLLAETGVIESHKIASWAKKQRACRLLIGLVTVHNFDRTEDEDLLHDYILHGIGTAAVEKALNSLLNTVELETGLYTSLPFSPGYCDWDITKGQEFIFNSIDPSAINVKVMPQSLNMVPVHTISFVSLMGAEKMDRNPCHFCNLKKCHMRRT